MKKIKDFKCSYANYTGIRKEFVNSIGLKLPEMYRDGREMAVYACAVRKEEGKSYCKLPFDTAVEAEAIGAVLKYDDSPLGPRKDRDLISEPKEILDLPEIDPAKGRMAEIIKACDILRQEGEVVVVEVRGLFDTLNGLIDIQKIMMTWVMEPNVMQQICDKIRNDIVKWLVAVKDHCDLLTYSDSSGGVNVIGPRLAKQMVEWFTYPLMKEIENILDEENAVWLCPKVAFMLIGTGRAEFKHYETGEGTYIDLSRKLPANIHFLGQKCNKSLDCKVKNHISYLELK